MFERQELASADEAPSVRSHERRQDSKDALDAHDRDEIDPCSAVRAYLSDHPAIVDSRKYVSAGRAVVRDEAARLLALFASAGTVHEKEPA